MASEESSTRATTDNGYLAGEDRGTWWRNVYSYLTGQMTDSGKAEFRHDRDIRNEAADCARCEKYRDFVLSYSPTVRFMRENINKLNGDINSENTHCIRCETQQTGGFDPKYGIVLCANHLRNRAHLEETLSHEMVHAWDHLRYDVDWMNNLRHAACTEIRASSLSGECKFWREFWTRGQWKVTKQHQECVRRRAVLSVMGRPICKNREMAQQAVDEVWESCFTDTRPFDEIYR